MSAYRILLVDDDAFFLEVYGEYLRFRAFEVETADCGEQALRMFAPGRYQLVVVDLVMPGISGLELIERIRSRYPVQDIVVVTGTEDARTAVRAMRLGVYDYLVKPIEREELMLVIERLQERANLYDEHSRLLHENILYAEIQQMFQRALQVMQTLDFDTVCERLLETLSEVCGAQGASLWLAREDGGGLSLHGYRGLIEMSRLPIAWRAEDTAVGRELVRGLPQLAVKDMSLLTRQASPAESLVCPLARDGRLVGVVQLVNKLGGGFDGRDASHAKVIGDCAATAVAHARRVRQLERVGLRDQSTSAYTMTFFVDYLGRELHKARSYHRSFAVVRVSVDNLDTLKQTLRAEVYPEVLRRLMQALSSVLRDIDVLARVTDDEMYILLPETDFLGGLTFSRRAREAILRSPFLADIDKQNPIAISFGPAAFPRDGDDVDQLFAACTRRLSEAQRSVFRRLHMEDVDFWGAVDLLVGSEALYGDLSIKQNTAFSALEDPRGLSRHNIFGPEACALIRQEIIAEVTRQSGSRGFLYLGSDWKSFGVRLAEDFRNFSQGGFKTYILGGFASPLAQAGFEVTVVQSDANIFNNHEVILLLSEHASFGLVGQRRPDGSIIGFHTADWTLVEGLVSKLQDAYHLQKGGV